MGTTAEKLAYLNDTKTAIKDAIVAKGVEVPEGTAFRGYADLIGEIKSGPETATVTVSGYSYGDALKIAYLDPDSQAYSVAVPTMGSFTMEIQTLKCAALIFTWGTAPDSGVYNPAGLTEISNDMYRGKAFIAADNLASITAYG